MLFSRIAALFVIIIVVTACNPVMAYQSVDMAETTPAPFQDESLQTQEDAIARALVDIDPSDNPEVLDVRLVFHRNLSFRDPVYPPDAPMWLVTIGLDKIDPHPMLPSGSEESIVLQKVYSATTGQYKGEKLIKGQNFSLEDVQRLPDIQGEVTIVPAPTPQSVIDIMREKVEEEQKQ